MCDIFLSEDLWSLCERKKVVFIGDSNVRALYKDVLCLYTKSEMITAKILKDKMEMSVFNDQLVFHKEKTNGREYREERMLATKKHNFSFYFITRVYNKYVEEVLSKMMMGKEPDVIVMNSCMWDMCRWGPKGVEEYKKNLITLMKRLNEILSKNCLVIWLTAPPISGEPYGGFLVVQLEFFKYCLRFHVMEANHFARKVVVAHGYDVLDVHYHLRMQVQRRTKDGIHWDYETMRYITNLLLTHISLAWGIPLPHRYESIVTDRAVVEDNNESFVLENEIETPVKRAKKTETPPPPSNKKWKRSKHHAYVKRARENLAKRNIKRWSPIRAPSRSPARYHYPSRPNRMNREPFRFSAAPQLHCENSSLLGAPPAPYNPYFAEPSSFRTVQFASKTLPRFEVHNNYFTCNTIPAPFSPYGF